MIALSQKLISREFRKHAKEFFELGNQAMGLWGELDQQGRNLSTCPALKSLVGKTHELWNYASHYGDFYLQMSIPAETTDVYFLKKSLHELVTLKMKRRSILRGLERLIERAKAEVRNT
ncbi:hypothetical protein ASD76_06275 [Altererythrobacter sp. Root672]|nr:hypothetical protein ASD76_06275 [Altererythrobacter sp. Root672]